MYVLWKTIWSTRKALKGWNDAPIETQNTWELYGRNITEAKKKKARTIFHAKGKSILSSMTDLSAVWKVICKTMNLKILHMSIKTNGNKNDFICICNNSTYE